MSLSVITGGGRGIGAATAARPKPRYYAPRSARLQAGFLNLLPERWLDRILLRVYKITPG